MTKTGGPELHRLTYTVPEAAEVVGVSEWLLRRMIRRGDIPHMRIGEKRIVIARTVLHRWVEQHGATS